MSLGATFESFEKELNRLVESFGKRLGELKSSDYYEAKLRDDFLNPFFRSLGWDRGDIFHPSADAAPTELGFYFSWVLQLCRTYGAAKPQPPNP